MKCWRSKHCLVLVLALIINFYLFHFSFWHHIIYSQYMFISRCIGGPLGNMKNSDSEIWAASKIWAQQFLISWNLYSSTMQIGNLATISPIHLVNFWIVSVLYGKMSFDSSLSFVFFSSITEKNTPNGLPWDHNWLL